MYMNERKSGTNHVTAALAAEANAAPIGRVSVVFEYKDMFKLNCTPTTGDIYVSSGAMIWNGRHCGVVNTENVKYTPPESDTLYKQIIVAAQYRKDASSGVETVSLVAIESEIVESQSAAMNLTLNTGSAEIGEATTLANCPLWRFVVTATTYTEPVQLFDVQKNYKNLSKKVADCQQDIEAEIRAREELAGEVDALKKGVVQIASELTGSTNYSGTEKRADYVAFILKFNNGEVMTIPAVPGTYTKYFYSVEDASSFSSASKVTVGIRNLILTTSDTLTLNYGSSTNTNICGHITNIYGIR